MKHRTLALLLILCLLLGGCAAPASKPADADYEAPIVVGFS